MKHILFLLLVCGIYIACNNQTETAPVDDNPNVKWVIKKVNANTATGKLFIDLDKDTEWDLTLHPADTNQVLSNTLLKKEFILQPGKYDLEINHIWIKGIPIEKGNDTRLKAGTLLIKNKTEWTLYDAAKQTVLINSNAAESRGLPIGKYKLTIKGEDHDIEIKDGKTVKY